MTSTKRIFPPLTFTALLLLAWLISVLPVSAQGNFERKAARAFYENRSTDRSLPTDMRILYMDSLLTEVSESEKPLLLVKRGRILSEGCRYEEAYRQYDLALKALPADSLRLRLIVHQKMSANALYAGHYLESTRNALDVIRSDKPDSLLWLDIEALSILVALDGYRGKTDHFRTYDELMEQCLARLEKSDAQPGVKKSARNRTLISKAVNEPDMKKAFEMYTRALAVETDSAIIDGLNNNIGLVHFRLKDYPKSRVYFESVLRSHRPGTARMCAVLNYIGSYINEGNGAGADSAVRKYSHILKELDHTPMEWEGYKVLYNVHSVNGRDLEGLPYLERAVELLDSLNSPRNELMTIDTFNEVSELLMAKKYAPQLSWSRKKTMIVLILAAALLITAGAVWFFHRKAKRKESEAGQMASRLDETLTRHREEKEESDQSLQMRGQELSSLKMRNEMLRKALDSIVADVNRLESPRSELSRRVQETVKSLSGAENTFNPRSITLESVNQAFFDKLYKEHPELTNAERDMCAYALMGLQPKEIAALTNRSVKTVNCIRHNMRKKLGISATESTEAYMRKLSAGLNTPDATTTE